MSFSGIGMGIVNADYDYNMARKIGAYRWPSILGVVDEQVYTYGDNNIISKENLKKFVTQMLPADLITTVSNSYNCSYSWFYKWNKRSCSGEWKNLID